MRGFLMAAGTPVKHGKAIDHLMEALLLPAEVAILKVKAHGKLTTMEAKGNHLADMAAKQAAVREQEEDEEMCSEVVPVLIHQPKDSQLQEAQDNASEAERKEWIQKGAVEDKELWVLGKKVLLPRSLYPATVQSAHGASHLSKMLMNSLINKFYVAPRITAYTERFCKSCVVCAKCNPGRPEKPP
ncbi:unnamed protein product, partial [Staurois parvus]